MRSTLEKTIAVLMVCVTTIGILLSLFFLFQTWRLRQPVTDRLQSALAQSSAILQTTTVGLDIVDQVVTSVYSSTLYMDDATSAMAQTIESTDSFFDTAGTFVGEDLINTITNTQRTLESAQSSALVIDNILTTLSNVPLIGINYDPSLPLSSALGEVSNSLDPIQGTLKSFQGNLITTQANMKELKDQLQNMEQNINKITTNLASAQTVIDNYRTRVSALQSWVAKAKISLPTWVTTLCVIITVIILLLILVQAAILLQGIYLLSSPATAATGTNEHKQDDPLSG
jgi:hypothetical protein